ncbi:MAG: glycosyltransferase, partial [Terriglobales bacterium]
MISVAIPVYNEEEIVHILHSRVSEVMNRLGERWEVVYVNDGSKDATLKLLLELQA